MTSPKDEVSVALAAVERLYSEGLAQHGASPRSVGWKDAASQQLRFAKLAQLLPTGGEPISVNDLGCGYGSMFAFLDGLPGVTLERYYGYDISEPMLDRARRATDERAQLVCAAEPTQTADYSFASGPFNVKHSSSDAAWQGYVEQCLRRLAASSRHGFAFNLMTTFVDYRQDNLFYADPCAFFAFCKREISPYVTLLHDYPLYEWTMLVRHP
ncbi:MAG: class I SAM-dependent methyltransferase [Solirubrobacteraceae bacterium]|nr:class I SAM-dependent methyltransferase [Solirubrobacteraceae bacterium]